MTEEDSLLPALTDMRAAPDYTMGALAQQTGVSPDTIRSWERRYGFPEPARTDTNRRLYSEQDIVAIRWLIEQTAQGQGISEAIAMLRERLANHESDPENLKRVSSTISASDPLEFLQTCLITGDFARACYALWERGVVPL